MKAFVSVLLTALAWAVVTEGRTDTLWGGLVAVPVALWAARRVATGAVVPRPRRIPAFLLFFLRHSLSAGVRVAWLAVRPRPALNPVLLEYPFRLPPGPREVFVATVSLLPGTLSARLVGETLHVHALEAAGADAAVARAELRVRTLFGLAPRAAG